MRNIMLAATALVAAVAVAAPVSAQTPNQPIVTTSFGGSASGKPAEPGTLTVRLAMRLWTEASYGTDSGQVGKTTTGGLNGSKNSGVYFGNYFRFYPGFDGVAANGLQYGAAIQIRQNSGIGGSKTGSISGNTLGNTLYVRTTEGYVGTPTLGKVFFGETFAALGKLMVGTMEDFDLNGGFNGDVPVAVSGAAAPNWIFPENSGAFTSSKITYISPSFSGFVFGTSFAPNFTSGDTSCGQAGASAPGCGVTASTPGGANKARNIMDFVAQYKGSFGPVAVAAEAGYMFGGRVVDSTATAATAKLKNYSVYDFGATAEMAGYKIGGHFTGGAMNGNNALLTTGQKNAIAFVGGMQKTFGSVIVGFQYLNELSGGTFVAGRNNMLHETGVVVGGAWDYAPGAILYADVMYVQRVQAGVDLLNGGASKFNNRTTGRAIQVGNRFAF